MGSPETVMTPADTTKFGILGWPDSNLSAFLLDGTFYVFASNANLLATQGLTTPDLNSLNSNHKVIKVAALPKGPKGSFDHDYAGGGAVYYDAPSGILIELYHGEYWYGGGSSSGSRPTPAWESLSQRTWANPGKNWAKSFPVLRQRTKQVSGRYRKWKPRPQSRRISLCVLHRSRSTLWSRKYRTRSCQAERDCERGTGRRVSERFGVVVFLKYYNGGFSQPGFSTRPSQQ